MFDVLFYLVDGWLVDLFIDLLLELLIDFIFDSMIGCFVNRSVDCIN